MTQSTDDPWGCGSDAPDLPSAVAAAVLALDWAAPVPFLRAEERDEAAANRYGQVQEIVDRALATQRPTEQQPAPMLRSTTPVKPENLQRALDLCNQWDKLCALELAAYGPPVGVDHKVVELRVHAQGLTRYGYCDLVDAKLLGVNVESLTGEVLALFKRYVSGALNRILGELSLLGVDTMAMGVKRDKAVTRLVNNSPNPQPAEVQP